MARPHASASWGKYLMLFLDSRTNESVRTARRHSARLTLNKHAQFCLFVVWHPGGYPGQVLVSKILCFSSHLMFTFQGRCRFMNNIQEINKIKNSRCYARFPSPDHASQNATPRAKQGVIESNISRPPIAPCGWLSTYLPSSLYRKATDNYSTGPRQIINGS